MIAAFKTLPDLSFGAHPSPEDAELLDEDVDEEEDEDPEEEAAEGELVAPPATRPDGQLLPPEEKFPSCAKYTQPPAALY